MGSFIRKAGAALALSSSLLFPSSAPAQPTDAARAEFSAAAEAADKASIKGPADIKLLEQAVLKLPDGLTYIPAKEAGRLLVAMGNRIGDGLLGLVHSPAPDQHWFVVMRFDKSGYVKDEDAKDWNVDEMLASFKAGTEEANKGRRERGIREMEIVGWVERPTYDAKTHRLVWSMASKDKGAPDTEERGVNYNTYALGREGYISMNLVTGMKTVQAEKPIAHQLLAALQYNEGKRYADFNSATDHVAEYGLAALVGGFAAKKLGLFAVIFAFLLKFWKIILIALAGLGALLPKILKKKAPEAPPPAAPPAPPAA
jgi:uncharacterized membrane-anchored protein